MGTPADFDRYIAEHKISEEEWPAAFALWIAERMGGPVPRFEKVESTKEHPLIEGDDLWPRRAPQREPRQRRKITAVPCRLLVFRAPLDFSPAVSAVRA